MACPAPRAFDDFVGGGLDAASRDALEVHVDTCERCRITLSETGRAMRRSRDGSEGEPEVVRLPVAGDVVGRYTIASQLGEGAMGVVYLARDPELGREIALKFVQPRLGEPEQELVQQRMLREGRLLARIDHENVVRVFDVGRWRGAVFVALARVQGVSLRAWLAADTRSTAAIVEVFRQCAAGLAAAHAAGVIHRDVKPDNVIIDAAGHARVTDFGLARTATDDEAPPVGDRKEDAAADPHLTRTRGMVGTPAYMAPEQHLAAAADERSDQFALCTALAEALAGTRPFAGDDVAAMLAAMKADRPDLGAGLPRRVRHVLARGLAFDPAQRWPSMEALRQALAPPRSPSRWWIAASAGAIAIAGALVFGRGRARDSCADVTVGMRETWSAGRITQLAGAFTATQQPFAPAAWSYARAAIDDYVARWGVARIEVCRAGTQRGELDASTRAATVRCLERQRLGLEALLQRWREGSGEVLALAAQAVDALADPLECASAGTAETAPADEERLRAFEARLANASADGDSGRVKEAVAGLRTLAGELPELPALHAEVLVELASYERALGDGDAARADLVAAVATAERAGAERVKARGWIALAEVAGEDGVRLPEARDALGVSSAVIERLGNPGPLRSEHEVAAALVELRAGDHAAAHAAIRRSLANAKELTVSERTRRRQILARVLIAGGDMAGALAELELAEREVTTALGAEAPALVYVLNSMIEPLDYLGRQHDAIARGQRALVISDASFGAASPRRVKVLGNLASIYGNVGELDKALELMRAQLIALARDGDDDTHRAAIVHTNLAATLLDAKRAAEALPHLERAQAIFTAKLGAQHPLVANVHSSLANANLQLGHAAKGVEHARAALAIRQATKAGVGYVAFGRFVLAQALVKAGQRAEGIAMGQLALEPVDGTPLSPTGREGELIGDIRAFLAEQAKQR